MAELKVLDVEKEFLVYKPVYFDKILDSVLASNSQVLSYRLKGGKV